MKNPEGCHTFLFSYDRNNRLACVCDDFATKMCCDYDCLGNVILEKCVISDGIHSSVRYAYNKNAMTTEIKITEKNLTFGESAASPNSWAEISLRLTGNDAEMRKSVNERAQQLLVDRYIEGRGQIVDGVTRIVTVTAALTVTVVLVASGGGTALVPGVKTIATLVLAGAATEGIIIVGESEILEGAMNVRAARSGSLDESYNFVRDTLCHGDKRLYEIVRLAFEITFGIVDMMNLNSPGMRKLTQAFAGTIIDTGLDGLVSSLTGQPFDWKESLARNAFANSLAAFIADPVDAVTGTYLIHATDFLLTGLPSSWKLERSYYSIGRKDSVFGRDWSFPCAGRVCRDTQDTETVRVHLETVTGHSVCFEKQDGLWVNQTRGTARFALTVPEHAGARRMPGAGGISACGRGGAYPLCLRQAGQTVLCGVSESPKAATLL